MEIINKRNIFWIAAVGLLILGFIFTLDKGLAIGLTFIAFLSLATIFVFKKAGVRDETIYWLFLIALLVRIAAVLFIYFTNFQNVFGGSGDYTLYHQAAQGLAQYFATGHFSIAKFYQINPRLYVSQYYPVVVAILYLFTIPEMIIGELFNAWLAILSIILIYLIVLELGGSKRGAFVTALIATIYPSFLLYGSLLLKDGLIIFLSLFAIFVALKTIKKFSWWGFSLFYLSSLFLTHFRFYIGYAILAAFIFAWFFLMKMDLTRKILYGIIIILLIGFIPQISANQGYYGMESFREFLTPRAINFYREEVYNPYNIAQSRGTGSSFIIETRFSGPIGFCWKYIQSYIYITLGPFPWQLKNRVQYLFLVEMIPWYFLFFYIVKGLIRSLRKNKNAWFVFVFAICFLSVLAIYSSNFGVVTRIRIPAFISLLIFFSFGFNMENRYLKRIEEKVKKIKII